MVEPWENKKCEAVAAQGSKGVSVAASLPLGRTICGVSSLFETDRCLPNDIEAIFASTMRHYRATRTGVSDQIVPSQTTNDEGWYDRQWHRMPEDTTTPQDNRS